MTLLHPEWVTKEFRLAKAAGLPLIRLHDLRYSYASSALAAGVPSRCCPSGLGTAASRSPRTCTVHTNERQDRDAANLAAKAILGE